MSEPLVECILIPRNPPATEEWLGIYIETYGDACEECWHSSCSVIRGIRERLGAKEEKS